MQIKCFRHERVTAVQHEPSHLFTPSYVSSMMPPSHDAAPHRFSAALRLLRVADTADIYGTEAMPSRAPKICSSTIYRHMLLRLLRRSTFLSSLIITFKQCHESQAPARVYATFLHIDALHTMAYARYDGYMPCRVVFSTFLLFTLFV